MLRRRGHPERASVLRAARANRRTSAPRGIDIEQMHRRPADRVAVGLRPHGSWSAAVARWNAGRLVCIPDRGSALPASGNSGGTAGELAPHPTRGHLPSVHSRLASTRSVASSRRRADGRHGLRRDITAAGAAGCPGAVSHRNPHRRRQTPPRDGAGSAFAALIPIPATEWCTVSSSRSASNASAGYPQSASEPSGLRRLFRSTWSGLAWADTTMPVPQVVNVVVPNADDVRFDAHYPRNFMRLLVNDCARSRSGSSLSVKGHRRRCARRLSGSLAEDV